MSNSTGWVVIRNLVISSILSAMYASSVSFVNTPPRVREADFDAPRLRARHERDAAGRRAVARRVREVDRRLEARHQALVRIGAGVGDRVERLRVLDDPADVVEREVREPRVAVAGEEIVAVLPDRLVAVHPRAV